MVPRQEAGFSGCVSDPMVLYTGLYSFSFLPHIPTSLFFFFYLVFFIFRGSNLCSVKVSISTKVVPLFQEEISLSSLVIFSDYLLVQEPVMMLL